MPKLLSLCCILVPIILSIILAILNIDNHAINELLVHNLLSRFKTGVFCLNLREENDDVIIAYGDLAATTANIAQGSILEASIANEICNNIIVVSNKDAFYSGLLHGTIGIGETYFREQWTCDGDKYDLGDIMTHLFWNVLNTAGPYTKYLAYFSKFEWIQYFYALGITKDQSQDMEDICYTYFDHRFFEKMLDETMQYSCALYNESTETLYDAQINKANVLIHKLNIFKHLEYVDRNKEKINILDVGSGWGFLANHINSKGAQFNVTAITISRDQHEYAIKRFGSRSNDADDKVTYELMDFRDLPKVYPKGYFHRIISVGVINHIHIRRLHEWFHILYDMLAPDGYFVMQDVVGSTAFANGNKAWMDINYACTTSNFQYKYIFPGGCLLLSDWLHEAAAKAGFIVMNRDFTGQHYAKTLREWRFNIAKNKKYLLKKNIVSRKKYLSHEMYLAQSEALYRTAKIEHSQFVFYKPRKDEIQKYTFEEYEDRIHLSWQ